MSGIEYIEDDLETHPECVHGPTFLFERTTTKGTTRFYACSACRDRKDCSFFLPEKNLDKISTKEAKALLKEKKLAYVSEINFKKLSQVLHQVRNTLENERCYCFSCNKFLINEGVHDVSHQITNCVTDAQLNFPTKFLKPLENDKVEAQYLFDDATIKTTIEIIKEFKFKNVLCIGTPRIFEYIRNNCNDMQCLLLDFDKRYHNFFESNEFCWYNLFNNYFFFSESKEIFRNFLKQSFDDIILIIDPPFGGRLEPISHTIDLIEKELKKLNSITKSLPILFYFPYFMEQHFNNHLPTLKMADYKVNYENHFLFSDGKKSRKYGSAVRIFTNLDLKKLKFNDDSYRFCELCERYVYKENNHCYLCNSCTSKDGRTYVHCNKCKKCVKPTWVHCLKCKKCAQPDHKCGQIEFNQSCFHCHEKGHKKYNCPNLDVIKIKRKRKEKYVKNKMLKIN